MWKHVKKNMACGGIRIRFFGHLATVPPRISIIQATNDFAGKKTARWGQFQEKETIHLKYWISSFQENFSKETDNLIGSVLVSSNLMN